eukprot:CAMPEP_0174251342 /NCGR_PEP_ID=MMETSP0439-20130205/1193_1 /TAXON_ID=0 /ORGANISM="Stereomyxa ramosa, Strain Chinc5" /LENGTH=84 /DNA_ID=CAMNT_0015331625 /DNA_START=12 /DNA_END=266 /DNA_ORIENTATION=+
MSGGLRGEVLRSYRRLLVSGRQYPNYNIREYIDRRVRAGFRENKDVTNRDDIKELLAQAQLSHELIIRQSTITGMYPHKKLVVE